MTTREDRAKKTGAHRQDRIPEVSNCEERGLRFQGFRVIFCWSSIALEPRVKQSIMAGERAVKYSWPEGVVGVLLHF